MTERLTAEDLKDVAQRLAKKHTEALYAEAAEVLGPPPDPELSTVDAALLRNSQKALAGAICLRYGKIVIGHSEDERRWP